MDEKSNMKIPLVDLQDLGKQSEADQAPDSLDSAGRQLTDAFSDIGFAYISNHGIPSELISRTFSSTGKFFELPLAEKAKLSKIKTHGYVAVDREKLSSDSARHELRESYDVQYTTDFYPDTLVPEFGATVRQLNLALYSLAKTLLSAVQAGLGVKDDMLIKAHSGILNCDVNASLMRVLYYPPVPAQRPPGTIRCGEHTDYGTITILLQDSLGGLEVKTRDGIWVPAPPVEGALLVNVGDLLQRWTRNRLIATEHRVLVPENEYLQKVPRRSIAYFIHPNNSAIVEPLDGLGGIPPVNAKEWLEKRYAETYQY